MIASFPQWIEDSLIIGLPVSRTFESEENCCNQSLDPAYLNEAVKIAKKEEVDAFHPK